MMERSEALSLDHALLRRLQVRVGDLLEEDLSARRRRHLPALSEEDTEAFKAELAHRVVDEHAKSQAEGGLGQLDHLLLRHAISSRESGAGVRARV